MPFEFNDRRGGIIKRIGGFFTRKQPEPVRRPLSPAMKAKLDNISKAKDSNMAKGAYLTDSEKKKKSY